MLVWTEQVLSWYKAAEQNSNYFNRLAEVIETKLPPQSLVHDLGCGNGALAFRLASRGFSVCAVDQSEQAVNEITRRNQETKEKVQVFRGDYVTLKGKIPYPIFCLCGDIREDLNLLANWESETALIVTLDDRVLPFKIEPQPRRAIHSAQVKSFLDRVDLTYQKNEICEDFGQPLLDLSDAKAFAKHHNPQASPDSIDAWLRDNLGKSTLPDYKYYLSSLKRVTIFTIKLAAPSRQVI